MTEQQLVFFVAVLGAGLMTIWVLFRPKERAAAQIRRAGAAIDSRQFDKALAYYDRAERLQARFQNPKVHNAFGFAIEHGRGFCWLLKDRFADAESHLRRAAEYLDNGAKAERAVVVHFCSEFATALFAQGKQSEGEALLERVEKLCAGMNEGDTRSVAEMLIAAAGGAACRNQYETAIRLANLAIKILSRSDSWHHGHLAEAQIMLASIHAMLGEWGRAQELIEQTLSACDETQLDESARDSALSQLGQILLVTGAFPKAIELLQRSFEHRKEIHGDDHIGTAVAMSSLAGAYRGYGDYATAEALYRQSHDLKSARLAPDDVILASTRVAFALLLCDLGKHHEADTLLGRAESTLSSHIKSRGITVPFLRTVRGLWYFDHLDFERAIACHREALKLAQAIYGESQIMTATFRGTLGRVLLHAGQLQEAEQQLFEALTIREAAPDTGPIDFAELLFAIAELYLATNRVDEAAQMAKRGGELLAGKLLPTNLTLAWMHRIFAQTHSRQGAHQLALEHLEKAETIHKQVMTADHPRLARYCNIASEVLSAAGENTRADEYRRRGEEIRSKIKPKFG